MIALYINGEQAYLQPNASIAIEIFSNLMDLDFLNGSKSLSFSLPTDPNAKLFNFAHSVANGNLNIFEEYPARIDFAGNMLFQGKFKLTSADRKTYKGNFKFDLSEIVEFRDKSIRDILNDEKHNFQSQDLAELNNYLISSSNVVFPTIKMNNNLYNRYVNGAFVTESDYKRGSFIPFLKVKYILELLLKKIGYRLENSLWTAQTPDFDKVTIWNNRELACELTVSYQQEEIDTGENVWTNEYSIVNLYLPKFFYLKNHVPNLTLADFINSLRKFFGILPVFDTKFKTVKLYFIKDILGDNEYIDWTEKANPFPEVANNDYKGLTFAFKRDEKDELIKDQIKEANYTRLADVNTFADITLDMLLNDEFFAVRFVKAENKFYQKRIYLGAWIPSYVPYHDNILDADFDEAKEKVETAFSPVNKSVKLQYKGGKNASGEAKIISGTGGALRIVHINPFTDNNGSVELTKSKNHRLNFPTNITANAASYIELGNDITFREEESGVEWTRYAPTTQPILEVETPETRPLLDKPIENPDFAARLFIYHGLQEAADSAIQYPYASSDIYSPKGTQISEFGLYWSGDNGLLEYFFDKFIQLKKYGFPVTYKLRLSLNDILTINVLRKIRIRESEFFIKEIKTPLSQHVKETEAVLIKIPTPAIALVPVEYIVYQDCNISVDYIVYKDCAATTFLVNFQINYGGYTTRNGTTVVEAGGDFYSSSGAWSGYEIEAISINGLPQNITNRNSMATYFSNIQENKNVVVTFRPISASSDVIVNVSAPNGGITSAQLGNNTTTKGANFVYVIALVAGYELVSISANGAVRTFAVGQTTFIEYNVQANTNIVILTRLTSGAPPSTYNVNVWVSAGGTSGQAGNNSVNAGSNFSYSFSANTGYTLDYVKVNGVAVGSYTIFNIQANQIVEIAFKPVASPTTYTVTTSVTTAGGNISPLGVTTKNQGDSFGYTVSVQNGYEINQVLLNGSPISITAPEKANGLFRNILNIQANQTVSVSFTAIAPATVKLTAMAGFGGSISPTYTYQPVAVGSNHSFNILADAGYEIDTITKNGVGQTVTNRNTMTYAITSISVDTNLFVTFRAATPDITITLDLVNNFGTANQPRVVYVERYSGSYQVRIIPNAGYQIDRCWVYADANGVASATEIAVNNPLQLDIAIPGTAQSITYKVTFKPL